jgi:hypothetical protein
MLALSDKNGVVEASIPGLSDASRVTIEECEDALKRLKSPDRYSRSKEFEGKRIEDVEGGWLLLNYARYRGKLTSDKIREQARIRQQRFREKQKNGNVTVTHNSDITANNAHADPDPTADPDPDINKKKNIKKKNPYTKDFELFWSAYPRKVAKGAAFKKWQLAKKMESFPDSIDELLSILEKHKEQDFWKQGKIYKPQNWLGDTHWEDEICQSEPPQSNLTALNLKCLTPQEAKMRRQDEVLRRSEEG